jgi:POT family proton-dependent oligopeptide transporter
MRQPKVPRERMLVILILTFFSMLFWSFFEQAGSSINNFTDRNVDRVRDQRTVTAGEVGRTVRIQPTQEQLGYHNGDRLFTLTDLDGARSKHALDPYFEVDWKIAADNVGMGIAQRTDEVPASVFQATNPIFILLFGLVFTALWGFLGQRGREPSTPFKFALGLAQLGLGFGAIWYGAEHADQRGMVAASYLVLGYLLHTTGELCISPVGLSMVTRLSPRALVSTLMGTWFLATAFSQYLAAIISQFTGVGHGGGGEQVVPVPSQTVLLYGGVFGKIAIAALASAAVCFALVPLLKRFMHEDEA